MLPFAKMIGLLPFIVYQLLCQTKKPYVLTSIRKKINGPFRVNLTGRQFSNFKTISLSLFLLVLMH